MSRNMSVDTAGPPGRAGRGMDGIGVGNAGDAP